MEMRGIRKYNSTRSLTRALPKMSARKRHWNVSRLQVTVTFYVLHNKCLAPADVGGFLFLETILF